MESCRAANRGFGPRWGPFHRPEAQSRPMAPFDSPSLANLGHETPPIGRIILGGFSFRLER